MFGGFDHLSKAAEAQSRQAKQTKQDAKEAVESIDLMLRNINLREEVSGRTEGEITREELIDFFARNKQMLEDPSVRRRLCNAARDPAEKLKLNPLLVAMQRENFLPLGINPAYGCKVLSQIDSEYPSDQEMLAARDEFVELCYETFLAILRGSAPTELQSTGTMSREQIFLFLDACDAMFNSPTTHLRLHQEFMKSKEYPTELCLEMQHDMMETLGFERVFGVQCLTKLAQQSQSDEILAVRLHGFQQLCSEAVKTSALAPEELERQKRKAIADNARAMADESQDTGRTTQKLSREEILHFLSRNQENLLSDPVRARLKKLARTDDGKSDLNRTLIDIQRSIFTEMGINKNFGVSCLNSAGIDFMGDKEVQRAIRGFAVACSKAWLTAIYDSTPKKVQTSGKLSRTQIINFADACNNLMNQPETRETLRSKFLEAGTMPTDIIPEMQRELFEKLGIERNFGVSCLSRVQRDFPGDRQLVQKLQSVEQTAQNVLMQAQLTDEELEAAEERSMQEAQNRMREQEASRNRMVAIQTAVENMTEEEKEALKAKMLPKWKTLMRLPNQDRATYLQRQPSGEQLEFAKINLVMVQESMKSSNPQETLRRYLME